MLMNQTRQTDEIKSSFYILCLHARYVWDKGIGKSQSIISSIILLHILFFGHSSKRTLSPPWGKKECWLNASLILAIIYYDSRPLPPPSTLTYVAAENMRSWRHRHLIRHVLIEKPLVQSVPINECTPAGGSKRFNFKSTFWCLRLLCSPVS